MGERTGDLSAVAFPRLLCAISARADETSILECARGPVKKRFYFSKGSPVGASSNVLSEVLGRLLMKEGVLTPEEYEKTVEVVMHEKRRHGEVLTSMGYITPEDLERFLLLQLKRRLWKVFGWSDGQFIYMPGAPIPEDMKKAEPLQIERVVLDGVSLGFYHPGRLKNDLFEHADERARFVPDTKRYDPAMLGLNLQEQRLVESFDSTRTLSEIISSTEILSHRAQSIVYTLMIAGAMDGGVEPFDLDSLAQGAPEAASHKQGASAEATGASRLNAELLFMRARAMLDKGDFEGGLGLLEKIVALNPAEAEYRAYLAWALYRSDNNRAVEALEMLNESLDLNPELDSAWHFLGLIHLESGRPDDAKKALTTAVIKNPWLLDALRELKRMELSVALKEAPRPYIKALDLSRDPFSAVPGDFTEAGQSQIKALEFLLRGVKRKTSPMLLTAAKGFGKTSLALELLTRLSREDAKVLCSFVLSPPAREIDLIRAINIDAGASIDAKTVKEQLLSLGMRVSQNKARGGGAVLIIDEAQKLADPCLKFVQYMARLKSLQIILIGEPMLIERLADTALSELNQKLVSRFVLTEFTDEEAEEYLEKKVSAYPQLKDALGANEISKILASSERTPGSINEGAAKALLEAASVTKQARPGAPEKIELMANEPEGASAPFEDTWSMPQEAPSGETGLLARAVSKEPETPATRLAERAQQVEATAEEPLAPFGAEDTVQKPPSAEAPKHPPKHPEDSKPAPAHIEAKEAVQRPPAAGAGAEKDGWRPKGYVDEGVHHELEAHKEIGRKKGKKTLVIALIVLALAIIAFAALSLGLF